MITSTQQKLTMSKFSALLALILKPLLIFVALHLTIQISESRQLVGVQSKRISSIKSHQNLISTSDPIVFDLSSLYSPPAYTMTSKRRKRSTVQNTTTTKSVDACQSKMEVITPYYATNSKGKLRAIVNSELMQQAIQVETCVR